MSISCNKDYREHFFNYFCSQPLEISKILDFHPEPQEALLQGEKKKRMNPHDLYERLVACRNEHAERFTSEQQLKICESNLELLAEQCCIDHKKYSIPPRTTRAPLLTSVSSFFNRVFHRAPPNNQEAPNENDVSKQQEKQPVQSSVDQDSILDLLKIVCSGPLPLAQILKLTFHTTKLCALESEEESPHVLYQQLVGIRDKYAKMIQPHHLSNFENNLKALALACCEDHVCYTDC